MTLDFDRLLRVGHALGNPHRLRILAALSSGGAQAADLGRRRARQGHDTSKEGRR